MKKLMLILSLVLANACVLAATDEHTAPSKPLSIMNEDEDTTVSLNTLNHGVHDVPVDDDENTYSAPATQDNENTRLSMNQSTTKDDDYN